MTGIGFDATMDIAMALDQSRLVTAKGH